MNRNIQQTKRNLTIAFSLIVFFVIFSLSITFFTTKYLKGIGNEKGNLSRLIKDVEDGKVTINDIINSGNRFEHIFIKLKKGDENKDELLPLPPRNPNFQSVGYINYVYINNNSEVISSNIRDDIDENYIISVNMDDKYLELKQKSGFLVKKFIVNDNMGTFILIRELRYSFIDYLKDIGVFFLFNLLFSILLYFIGLKFVNRTFIPVEANIKDMNDFIHNAGHELKTPISVIDSNIQIIDDTKSYDAEMTKELKNEVIRLNSIIDGLIRLSNIGIFKDSNDNNLKNICLEIIKEFKFKIDEKKLNIVLDIDEKIIINSNKDYFYIFLSNIIGNAIKYNIKNGKINISYKDGTLKIQDSGFGINNKELDKIFDRFFKGDKSRKSEGFGIGLSLVKKIADVYSWNINVESEEGKGTIFFIKF